jgi:oligosaccharide repeat unit polymerase
MILDVLLVLVFATMMVAALIYFRRDWLDPLSVFTILNSTRFVLRPAVLLFGLDTPHSAHLFRTDPADLARTTILIFMLGYASYVLGYALGRGRLARSLASKLPGYERRRVRVKRLGWITLAGIALSALTTLYYVAKLGGVAVFMREARLGLFAGVSFLQNLPELTAFFAALVLHFAMRERRGVAMAIALLVGSIVILFTMGERGGIVAAFLFLAVLHHFCVKPLGVRAFAAYGVALALMISGLGIARKSISGGGDEETSLVSALGEDEKWSPVDVLLHLNSNATDYFMIIVQDYDVTNYHYGDDFYRGLIGVVPRSIWPNKPERITVGQWFTERYFPGKPSGRPITAVGGYYLNFGLVGVFVGMLLSGFFGRILWNYLAGAAFHPWAVVIYLAALFKITSWGMITTTMPMAIVLTFVPLWFVHALTTERRRATGAS